MIKKYFKNAVVKKDFDPKGLSSLIQNTKKEDILFLNVTNSEKVDSFLKNDLVSDFSGLIVATKLTSEIEKYNYVIVDYGNFISTQACLIDEFYPEKNISYLGVTGTNGKTTTCWLVSEIGRVTNKNVLYLGTIGIYLNGKKISNDFVTTTPTLLDLRKVISSIDDNIDIVVLEISSHALVQNRLMGLELDGAAWTNFSQDHLDYHKTMDDYFNAKEKIVKMLSPNAKLFINKDELSLYEKINSEKKEYSKKIDKDIASTNSLFFKSSFNIKNLELACSLMKLEETLPLETLLPPPGRFEFIKTKKNTFIIDYAHTPDALENVLKELKKSYSKSYIITVVGCGGDRDKTKRSLMGDISRLYSDYSIFTSDNPRSENPMVIIKDMITSEKDDFDIEVKRESAIILANKIGLTKNKDVIILIAGKGHENYQEIKGVRKYFSDAEVVRSLC